MGRRLPITKNQKVTDAHKIGAAISGPRIAGEKLQTLGFFFSESSPLSVSLRCRLRIDRGAEVCLRYAWTLQGKRAYTTTMAPLLSQKRVYTIGPQRRVYTIEASDPEKKKRRVSMVEEHTFFFPRA